MDVKTAGRTVDLFEAFSRTQTPLTLSEIGRILGAPSSSCFNLVRALESRGYLYSVGARRTIYPTRKLYDVASAILRGEPVIKRIEPVLTKLRDSTKETIIFGTRQNDKALYLSVVEGPQTIRYISHAGDRKPLHSSAIGKALLGTLGTADRDKLVDKLKLSPVTGATITDRNKLIIDVVSSVERGYSKTQGENVEDVMAVAKPVKLDAGHYAIAVAGPIDRMRAHEAEHVKELEAVCASIADKE